MFEIIQAQEIKEKLAKKQEKIFQSVIKHKHMEKHWRRNFSLCRLVREIEGSYLIGPFKYFPSLWRMETVEVEKWIEVIQGDPVHRSLFTSNPK